MCLLPIGVASGQVVYVNDCCGAQKRGAGGNFEKKAMWKGKNQIPFCMSGLA